jgi:predicted dinucleotide-binding enzyme
MINKPVIAIIGATERMGSTLAGLFAQASQRMVLVDTAAEKVFSLASELKDKFPAASIEVQTCAREASWEADIIIIASTDQSYCTIAERIQAVAIGKIVISVSSIIKSPAAGENEISAAEELQKLLPYSKVIKTFNALMASDFVSAPVDGSALDIYIAGNDEEAMAAVEELVKAVGFRPVMAGDLTASRRLEQKISAAVTK